MAYQLYEFLLNAYERHGSKLPKAFKKERFPIQIDDQDDNDHLGEFCTIFVIVKNHNKLNIEISCRMPVTAEIRDLAEIYGGYASQEKGKICLELTRFQVDALLDLAAKIRKTAFMGKTVNNPNWHRISARTISSLHRFVRIIKEYQRSKISELA